MRLYHGSNVAFGVFDETKLKDVPVRRFANPSEEWTMSVKQKQLMEYATQNLVAMLVEREGLPIQEAMRIVYHSALHAKLLDVETGLYLEGSEYLYGLLEEERASSKMSGAAIVR